MDKFFGTLGVLTTCVFIISLVIALLGGDRSDLTLALVGGLLARDIYRDF